MKKRVWAMIVTVLLTMAMAMPVSAEEAMPRLVDDADILDDEQEIELLNKLDEISERQEYDIVIVTIDSLEGYAPREYADDFYDYNGYESDDGILFLLSMGDRDWAISTFGSGVSIFTDAGQEYMTEQFVPMLSSGDYLEGFDKFADLCDQFITQAYEAEPYDVGNLPKEKVSPIWIPLDILIGMGIAWVIAMFKKSSLKSIKEQTTAQDYTRPGSMVFTVNRDQLVNRTTTSRRIPKSTSSSGGGSSTHTSSSGRTHGGSSGKF